MKKLTVFRVTGLRITAVAMLACMAFVIAAGASADSPVTLVGTFKLASGSCAPATGVITGSYFRLIFPGGSVSNGPFFENASSMCVTKSYTTLAPGRRGGIVTGSFQPNPAPAFSAKGGGRATAISRPVLFAAVSLSLSTNPTDPQTRRSVPPPSIVESRGRLTGQVEALSIAWNKTSINQGSPKPGGLRPGLTMPVKGTYNVRTHGYAITWTSQIRGGPFTGFVGYWHLSGTFAPAPGTSVPQVAHPSGTNPISHKAPVRAKNPPTKSVALINCDRVTGGWSAGGVANDPSQDSASYLITIAFTTEGGKRLASGTTSAIVVPGKASLWSTTATFTAPGKVRCVLQKVTAN
jgi:hypothetical protein